MLDWGGEKVTEMSGASSQARDAKNATGDGFQELLVKKQKFGYMLEQLRRAPKFRLVSLEGLETETKIYDLNFFNLSDQENNLQAAIFRL